MTNLTSLGEECSRCSRLSSLSDLVWREAKQKLRALRQEIDPSGIIIRGEKIRAAR